LKITRIVLLILVLIPVVGLELVFVPVDRVLASPPNISLEVCSEVSLGSAPQCGFKASYYAGAGSLTYCLLGEGALYLRGVYYPLTQPGASPAREISNHYCPAMRK
jgi:hypothetical protein